MAVWHFFLHVAGIDDVSSNWYGFWSGFASDIPLFGVFFVVYRRLNCHIDGCWRIQWRTHGDHSLCRKHHPADPPKADDIKTAIKWSAMKPPDAETRAWLDAPLGPHKPERVDL